jgi:hypothetical protein
VEIHYTPHATFPSLIVLITYSFTSDHILELQAYSMKKESINDWILYSAITAIYNCRNTKRLSVVSCEGELDYTPPHASNSSVGGGPVERIGSDTIPRR